MIDIDKLKENLKPCSNHGCIIAPDRKGAMTNGMCHCSDDSIKMRKLAYILRDEITTLRAKVAELEKDAERLAWLHTINIDRKDADGWEYGVAKVRFHSNGMTDVLWCLSDHSDIDKAMEGK
jgi:hypothetical protein